MTTVPVPAPARAEILRDVRAILAEQMGVAPSTAIDEETQFFADLGLASIDAVVLGEALQQHYGRPLPFGELMAEIGRRTDRDLTIGELVGFLQEHLT
ncbi:MAG: acyl carrier protein [Isosphaeraceae bacterium]